MPDAHLRLEDDGAPAFAAEVVEIINSALASASSPTSPAEAATALDSLFNKDYAKHGTAGSFLWWFWDLVHELARQLPYNGPEQDLLAKLIKALHDLPPKTVKLGDDWGDGKDSVELWAGLPMFGNTFREKLDDSDEKARSETHRKERRVNLQAYAAKVAGFGLVPMEAYAIWALVDALEGTITPIRGAPDEVNPNPAAIDDLSFKIACAAEWIVHAGHILHGRDEEVNGATSGPLWRLDKKEATKQRRKLRGTDGLCPQRWQLWKERFAAVRDADGVDDLARKEAGAAFARMEEIESAK